MKRLFLQLLAMCSMVAPWATARADEAYPTHPLRWVLPYQAGSQPDIIARFLAQRLGTRLHQVVVVENRPGAGGLIGADIVAKAAPDGYTLGYLSTQHLAHKFLLKSVPYDAVKDFQPIQLVGSVPQVMVVAQANPAKTMADFTARAKASATPVTFGSGGLSSPAHLAGQALASAAGFQAQHVPYKGSPEALSALIGGQVDYAVVTLSTAAPMIKGGRIRGLGVSSEQRSPLLPDVPTLTQAGVPGFIVESWGAMTVPCQTSKPVVDTLSTAMLAVLANPETKKFFEAQGTNDRLIPLDQFPSFLASEQAKMGTWIKDAGIEME